MDQSEVCIRFPLLRQLRVLLSKDVTGVPHINIQWSLLVSEFSHLTFLPHMNCASLLESKEIAQFQLPGCLPWRAQHRIHQAVTSDFYTLNASLISTRLAAPYWTICPVRPLPFAQGEATGQGSILGRHTNARKA